MKNNNTQNEMTIDQFLEIKVQNFNKFKEDWEKVNKEDKNNQKMDLTMWEAMSNGY